MSLPNMVAHRQPRREVYSRGQRIVTRCVALSRTHVAVVWCQVTRLVFKTRAVTTFADS